MIFVYTAVFGGYDKLRPSLTKNPRVSYQLYTEDIWHGAEVTGNWSVFTPCDDDLRFPRKLSRWYKTHPHKLWPNHTISIWHGGWIGMKVDPLVAIDKWLPPGADLAIFKHPHRKCAYKEANACREQGKGNPAIITAQLSKYRKEGFPLDFGLSACLFIIRRNNERTRQFNEMWWDEIDKGSSRDQISFDYCRWKMPKLKVSFIPGDPFAHPGFVTYEHNK